MTLTNSQYDAIQREYDAIQSRNRRILEQRREEIFQKLPAYKETADAVVSLSVSYGKRLLNGEPNIAQTYHEKISELSRLKTRILTSAGYPTDYLDPIYDCPDCQDTGHIGGERCHCLEQRIIDCLYTQSNLTELLSTENFSALSYDYYQGDDLQNFKKAVETGLSFIRNFRTDYQNLLFYGAVGTGKTFLANCIAHEMLNQGFSVIYFSATGFFNLLSRYSFDANSKEMLYKTYEELYNCDLVIIDDLGTELTNSFTNSHLFSFLNERHLNRKSVIVSTNLNLEELKNRYSERIFSRLANNFTFRKLSGSDIRVCKNI